MNLLQIPTPPAGAIENALLALAAIGSMILLGKKLAGRKTPPDAEFVTKAELRAVQTTVEGLRDKIDARFLALAEKIEALGAALHQRLNELHAGLARVDERTRYYPPRPAAEPRSPETPARPTQD